VFLYAFDLIELNGDDLRRDPLQVRKATLVSILAKARPGVRFNEHIEGDGPTVFSHACKVGLEGIVSKRKDFCLPLRPLARLTQNEERGCTRGEAGGGGGLGQREMAINYRSHFAYRIDAWHADGENVIEHLAGVEDLQVAKATYLAACQRWPGTPITLRQGTRVIEDSRRTRIV
jgi:hypothetical protein